MTKLLKDPLVHFLAIGAALFAFSAWRGQSIGTGRQQILISSAQIEQARDAAALVQGRPPTDDELAALIEPTMRDEILYREALALGLDENDDEVRRRLIEKMQYLSQDPADPEPSFGGGGARALRLRARAFRSRRSQASSRFISARAHAGTRSPPIDEGLASCAAARAGERGRPHAAARTYENAPREQVEVLFGEALAKAVFTLAPGDWHGPFESDFGLHLVRLGTQRTRLPPFEEIREQVLAAFAAERAGANEAKYREMRARYESSSIGRRPRRSDARPRRGGVAARRVHRRSLCASAEPGILRPRRDRADQFEVQWKVSISGGLAAALEPKVPEGCSIRGGANVLRRRRTPPTRGDQCPEGLAGREFEVEGLPLTQTDVLLRVDYLDGIVESAAYAGCAERGIPERPSSTRWCGHTWCSASSTFCSASITYCSCSRCCCSCAAWAGSSRPSRRSRLRTASRSARRRSASCACRRRLSKP